MKQVISCQIERYIIDETLTLILTLTCQIERYIIDETLTLILTLTCQIERYIIHETLTLIYNSNVLSDFTGHYIYIY